MTDDFLVFSFENQRLGPKTMSLGEAEWDKPNTICATFPVVFKVAFGNVMVVYFRSGSKKRIFCCL